MRSRILKYAVFILILGILLSGCGDEEATPVGGTDASGATVPLVVADGRLVPSQYARLSFLTSGNVVEILVEEGGEVREGDIIARLSGWEQLDSQVASAEHDLLSARQALDTLHNDHDQDVTNALEVLTLAEETEHEADRREANVATTATDYTKSQAEQDLQVAQDRLEYAQAEYDLLLEGPDPEKLAEAESRVAAAEAALIAAQNSRGNLDLRAPFNGTVVSIEIVIGQFVPAGQAAVVLANLDDWFVETTNLTEIEVVNVHVGQSVSIAPDSLLDTKMSGTVISIKDVFEEKSGDITFTARISLGDIDQRLRWGMTVAVTFEK